MADFPRLVPLYSLILSELSPNFATDLPLCIIHAKFCERLKINIDSKMDAEAPSHVAVL